MLVAVKRSGAGALSSYRLSDRDWTRMYETCPACQKPILPQLDKSLRISGKKYHLKCFVCSQCGVDFPHKRFFMKVRGRSGALAFMAFSLFPFLPHSRSTVCGTIPFITQLLTHSHALSHFRSRTYPNCRFDNRMGLPSLCWAAPGSK